MNHSSMLTARALRRAVSAALAGAGIASLGCTAHESRADTTNPVRAAGAPSSARAATATAADSGPAAAMRVSVGVAHACAIRADGVLFCWGDNDSRELGAGVDSATLHQPHRVADANAFREVAAGSSSTCAVAMTGETLCWGFGDAGQLGSGKIVDSTAMPTAIIDRHRFAILAATPTGVCGVDARQAAWCWGAFEAPPTLGRPVPTHARPVLVASTLKLTALAMRSTETCGVATDGRIYCWTGATRQPNAIDGVAQATAVALGESYGCALDRNGAAWCWGENNFGQLGAAKSADSLPRSATPVPVAGAHRFRSIAAAPTGQHTCAVDDAGAAWCWGDDAGGVLGASTSEQCAADRGAPRLACSTAPVAVGGGATFTRISVGEHEVCGVTSDARIVCWGTPEYPEEGPQPGGPGLRVVPLPQLGSG